jgi:hypothetical protein
MLSPDPRRHGVEKVFYVAINQRLRTSANLIGMRDPLLNDIAEVSIRRSKGAEEEQQFCLENIMSDVQLYLFEYDKNKKEATRIAEDSAKSINPDRPHAASAFANHGVELERKELKLLDLIQSLGEYLNHEEAPLRGKGTCLCIPNSQRRTNRCVAMSYVAEVLQAIPPKVLTGQQSR